MLEQMRVPTWRVHTRAVAALHRQAAVRPGHPGQGRLDLREEEQADEGVYQSFCGDRDYEH